MKIKTINSIITEKVQLIESQSLWENGAYGESKFRYLKLVTLMHFNHKVVVSKRKVI